MEKFPLVLQLGRVSREGEHGGGGAFKKKVASVDGEANTARRNENRDLCFCKLRSKSFEALVLLIMIICLTVF